jgi:hypothetical protein
MKNFLKTLCVINAFFIFLFFTSCKDKNSIPVVLVSPSAVNINVTQGDVLTLAVSVSSDKDNLSRFVITTQKENSVLITVLDSTITGKNLNYNYTYYVPDTIQGSVFIKFTAYDENADKGEYSIRVIISPDVTSLTEIAGNIIYSKYSGKPDAFDINTCTVQFSSLASQDLLDIADSDTIPSDSILSKAWHSPANNMFVLFNGFDYANATVQSAQSAYNAGTKLALLSNLNVNDIIVTKVKNGISNIYAVIKITNIVETPPVINERYEFNIKK